MSPNIHGPASFRGLQPCHVHQVHSTNGLSKPSTFLQVSQTSRSLVSVNLELYCDTGTTLKHQKLKPRMSRLTHAMNNNDSKMVTIRSYLFQKFRLKSPAPKIGSDFQKLRAQNTNTQLDVCKHLKFNESANSVH